MISKIAWRNILRNKRRSLILILSVMIGTVAVIFTEAFGGGMMQQMLTNQIGADVGYIQIHGKGYQTDPKIENSITDPDRIRGMLAKKRGLLKFTERLITFGLVSSAYNSSGVSIVGIMPNEEQKITTISKCVVKGSYLSVEANQILISSSTAEKLKVGLGDKIVIMASQLDGSVGSEACRICGIYETFNSGFDQTHVYVSVQTAAQMLNVQNRISEFVINPQNPNATAAIADKLEKELPPDYETLTYKDMLPLLVAQIELYNQLLYLVAAIIGIALVFGIIDTMLMAVMERTHEFGVSMAIGMSNKRIFSMVILEAFYLGIIGTVLGLAVSFTGSLFLDNSGINLSAFSASMKSVGIGTTVYPVFNISLMISSVSIIPIISVLGAVYPALRAIRFQPVEAIRAT